MPTEYQILCYIQRCISENFLIIASDLTNCLYYYNRDNQYAQSIWERNSYIKNQFPDIENLYP